MCSQHMLHKSRRNFLRQIASFSTGLLAINLIGCGSNGPVTESRLAIAPTPNKPSVPAQFTGCSLKGAESQMMIARLSQIAISGESERAWLESSGDARLDKTLGILLADMATTFKVRPGFAFYDYGGADNALAMPDSYLPDTTGTVLFGRTLLQQMLNSGDYGDMPIMGTCAHEFGHIVQYHGVYERLAAGQETAKRVELHADFLAGYYIGKRKTQYAADELVTLGKAWEDLGDTNFADPQHHGTPEERLAAVEAGYRMAAEPGVGIAEAITGGLYYLGLNS